MPLHRPLGDPEACERCRSSDQDLGHEREHLALAGRELVEWIVRPPRSDEFLHERRIDDRAAAAEPFEVREELVEISRCDSSGGSRCCAPLPSSSIAWVHLDVCGEDENRGFGKLLADEVCRVEALGRVGGRHPDVDDREIQ